jgi:hypothetical protein
MKQKITILLLLLSLAGISGCIDVLYEITIDKDDTEIVMLRVDAPALVAPYLKDLVTDMRNGGFSVETEYVGDRLIVTGRKRLMKGQWEIPTVPGYITITKVNAFDFYVTDYILFKRYVLNVNYTYKRERTKSTSGSDVDLFQNIPLTFVVNYRGKIIKTNATNWDKKSATWAFNMKRFGNLDIQLVTYRVNYLLVTAIILVFIGILILVIYLLVRLLGPGSPPAAAPLKEITGPAPPRAIPPPKDVGGKKS